MKIKGNEYALNFFSSFLSSDKVGESPQLRRPETTYGFNFSKKFNSELIGNFAMNLNYNHYGKHFDTHSTSFSTIEMDSTDIIDLSLNKKYEMYDLQFNITNLLNEKYQRPHGYSQNERLLNIGIKYTF